MKPLLASPLPLLLPLLLLLPVLLLPLLTVPQGLHACTCTVSRISTNCTSETAAPTANGYRHTMGRTPAALDRNVVSVPLVSCLPAPLGELPSDSACSAHPITPDGRHPYVATAVIAGPATHWIGWCAMIHCNAVRVSTTQTIAHVLGQ
ncbi:hypothetical protein COO60DRAFT_1503420 [Scenedesmus sp. NREL 46B-D3]|nr:hypothetical protein COO60DRAFT_1503420 [Scenedesmus sp. NREL 46B-D3]